MQTPIWIALVAVATATLATVVASAVRRGSIARTNDERGNADAGEEQAESAEIPYATEATEEISSLCLRLAFGVARFDYQIFDEHVRVLSAVEKALGNAAEKEQYFPRRPLLLPKLLQALNDTDSTRKELVRLIIEDPTLAGTTLKRANNAFYRMSAEPVDSLDRAVALLGTDGLRGLLSTAILQPVFRLPKGFFDRFAEIAWEHAQRSAASSETYAHSTGDVDPFVAQLLGVLRSLATLVLFRVTLDKYRESPNVLPRPEVFIRILQAHRSALAVSIARTWMLSDASLTALEEQNRAISPSSMSELGRAVYYGELSASLAIATVHDLYSAEGARAILLAQGLTPDLTTTLLQAAQGVDLNP